MTGNKTYPLRVIANADNVDIALVIRVKQSIWGIFTKWIAACVKFSYKYKIFALAMTWGGVTCYAIIY